MSVSSLALRRARAVHGASGADARQCTATWCSNCGVAATSTCSKCSAAVYCSRICQAEHWQATHRYLCSPNVEVALVEGKGTGVLARRDFATGDVLIREKPLIVIPALWDGDLDALEPLPLSKQAMVTNLSDAWDDPATALGRFRTNSIPLGVGDARYGGLFALASRLNHACKPNARYVWRDDLKRELVFAQKPISAGEEITVSYSGDLEYAPLAQRKAHLAKSFNVDCHCVACAEPSDASDARMVEIQELIESVPRVARAGRARQALEMSERTLELMRQEAVDVPVHMLMIHFDAYQNAATCNSHTKARTHLRAAWESAILCKGRDAPAVAKLASMYLELQTQAG